MRLGVTREDVSNYFRLFMTVDEDNSQQVTLEEFFKYLQTEWSPFIGKAFRQFDTDTGTENDSADQLKPDEFIVGLLNYCTLTPESLARFAFELYDDDGSEFISRDELALMVDDISVAGGSHLSVEATIDQLLSILDADGDGVIEYDEWKKVLSKGVSVLKPAILLQNYLQRQTFGQKYWARQKAKVIPILNKMGHPNVLQFYRKEIEAKVPDLVEQAEVEAWLGASGGENFEGMMSTEDQEKGNNKEDKEGGDNNKTKGNTKKMKKKKIKKGGRFVEVEVSDSESEGEDEDKDNTQHGFVNPFRNAKVATYGAVTIRDEDEELEFEDVDEEGNPVVKKVKKIDGMSEEEMVQELLIKRQIREAPKLRKGDGALVYPDGRVVEGLELKDREHGVEREGRKKKFKGTKKEEEALKQEEIAKRAEDRQYRGKMVSFARAKAEQMVAKHDLFIPHLDKPVEKQAWENRLVLGVVPLEEEGGGGAGGGAGPEVNE